MTEAAHGRGRASAQISQGSQLKLGCLSNSRKLLKYTLQNGGGVGMAQKGHCSFVVSFNSERHKDFLFSSTI